MRAHQPSSSPLCPDPISEGEISSGGGSTPTLRGLVKDAAKNIGLLVPILDQQGQNLALQTQGLTKLESLVLRLETCLQDRTLQILQSQQGIHEKLQSIDRTSHNILEELLQEREKANQQRGNILLQLGKVQQQQDHQWAQTQEDREESIAYHEKMQKSLQKLNVSLKEAKSHHEFSKEIVNQKYKELLNLLQNSHSTDGIIQQINKINESFAYQAQQQQLQLGDVQKKLEKLDEQHKMIIRELVDESNELTRQHEQQINLEHEVAVLGIQKQLNFSFQSHELLLAHEKDSFLQEIKMVMGIENHILLTEIQEMFAEQEKIQKKQIACFKELRESFPQNESSEKTHLEKVDDLLYAEQSQKETLAAIQIYFHDLPPITPEEIAMPSPKVFESTETRYFYETLKRFLKMLCYAMHPPRIGANKPDQETLETMKHDADFIGFIPITYRQSVIKFLEQNIKKADEEAASFQVKERNPPLEGDNELVIVEEAVYAITFCYQNQIMQLTEEGIQTLAECAAQRIFLFMITGDKNDFNALADQQKIEFLIGGVREGNPNNVINTSLITKNKEKNKDWTAEGLFKRTGLQVLETGECFIRKKEKNLLHFAKAHEDTRHEKYGFRFIHQAEITKYTAQGFIALDPAPIQSSSNRYSSWKIPATVSPIVSSSNSQHAATPVLLT